MNFIDNQTKDVIMEEDPEEPVNIIKYIYLGKEEQTSAIKFKEKEK